MDNHGDQYISVDIESVATSLENELGTLHTSSTEYCIYRVPRRLHQSNEKDYTPKVISVGPFHHGRDDLKPMEEMKRRYLISFLRRTSRASMEDFLRVIKRKEAKIRNCYAENIELNSDNFVKMILMDAAFVIEVFLGCHFFDKTKGAGDPVYDRPWLIIDVKHDLWLLENQLPFFILKDLFDLADIPVDSNENEKLSLVNIIHEFCNYYWDFFGIQDNLIEEKYSSVQHLVDFLIIFILPSGLQEQKRPPTLTTPSVTELHQAGVKLKVGSSKNLFDIRFNKGVLGIPQIKIRRSMEILLKNLLAFEQCHCYDSYISDYVVLISYLADTSKDVDLLVQNRIIEHRLRNSEAVSDLFHNFVQGFRLDREDFYFSSLVENLNKHCENRWHRWRANLKQNYFNTPWASISVIAAVILLILTSVQTLCSVLQV